jgi:hypothetical protein
MESGSGAITTVTAAQIRETSSEATAGGLARRSARRVSRPLSASEICSRLRSSHRRRRVVEPGYEPVSYSL